MSCQKPISADPKHLRPLKAFKWPTTQKPVSTKRAQIWVDDLLGDACYVGNPFWPIRKYHINLNLTHQKKLTFLDTSNVVENLGTSL